MKRIANTSEEPIVIPVVVVLIHIEVPLVTVAVEDSVLYKVASVAPPFEYP
jgi:hypothetical protein